MSGILTTEARRHGEEKQTCACHPGWSSLVTGQTGVIKIAATICLVPQLRGGPLLYWDGLAESCRKAAKAGFDAVEFLVPSPDALSPQELRGLFTANDLKLTGIGTGAGFLLHKLHLCSPDAAIRRQAADFIGNIIDLAGGFGGFAIIGSMKGSIEPGVERATALGWLRDALHTLGMRAARHGVPLILEPLNRYETNLINRLEEGADLIRPLSDGNVKLLADLFHMNIEEVSIAEALRGAATHIGHIHFVDSNRRPAGSGHLDFAEIGRTLREIGYHGYLSAEALPYPDSDTAARQTIETFRKYIAPSHQQ